MRGYCLLIVTGVFLLLPISAIQAEKSGRQRRILCDYDGTSTLCTRNGSQGPVPITVEDLKEATREPAFEVLTDLGNPGVRE